MLRNKILKIIFVLVLIASVGVAALSGYIYLQSVLPEKKILVHLDRGISARQTARLLKQKGIIPSEFIFLIWVRCAGKASKIQVGTYSLKAGDYRKIIADLSSGNTISIKVTIPEGWSAYQIGQRLAELKIIADAEKFNRYVLENHLEGTLFPLTYSFEPNISFEAITTPMTQQLQKNYSQEWIARTKEMGWTLPQILTLASILEREVEDRSEFARVSSVYHNRLKKHRALESCPTVQYALGAGRFWKEHLTYEDLKVKSPYNTYRVSGLPPAPICNPGKASIQAALYPESTPYYFFVSDGTKHHLFAKTFAEHSHNRSLIKKLK